MEESIMESQCVMSEEQFLAELRSTEDGPTFDKSSEIRKAPPEAPRENCCHASMSNGAEALPSGRGIMSRRRIVSGSAFVNPAHYFEAEFTLEPLDQVTHVTYFDAVAALEQYCDANGCNDGQAVVESGTNRLLLCVQFREERSDSDVSDVELN
jgi:hypothetical protein